MQNQNGYQFSNKRANYYKMKGGAGGQGPNGKFNRNGNAKGNRNGKMSGSSQWNKGGPKGNGKGFKNAKTLSAADLDKELDGYLMKNPNAEDRTATISNHLDKELDDYFKGQPDQASKQ